MNSKKHIKYIGIVAFGVVVLGIGLPPSAPGYEIFIYRRFVKAESVAQDKKIILHGDFFGQLQAPSTFPSYNDLSGETDRWNFGFHNLIPITPTTWFHAQLVTHDSDGVKTKFDWHFSLRQSLTEQLVLVIGHDSDHDADHTSYLRGKPFYTNRNYIGFAVPFSGKSYLVEPFAYFFHHTNQRAYLDLSGEQLKQEVGLRIGAALTDSATLSLQIISQSSATFHRGEAWLADLILRLRLTGWFELAAGGGVWKDWEMSPSGKKQTFSKLFWGIVIPF